ncbi:lysophospholipid acyltransferase family protein [Pseudooceanicola sp.]|uniref:lysophospholipid acyltransferase family protein n=1 Tax=Pseudooceanicola sp. TaxID=1914328 RepID=UPI0035C69D41
MEPKDLPPLTRAGQYLVNLILGGMVRLALALPYRLRLPLIGGFASRILSPLAGWPKRIRANLAHAWPDLPTEEVEKIVRQVPDNAARTLIEIYSGAEFKARLKDITPEGPGWSALEEARAAGRPVFLISGHFGNYDAVRAFVAMQYGDVGGLYRPLNNVYFNRHYVRAILQTSQPVFERGRRGLAEMMKFVRQGNIMAMLSDQHFGHGAPLTFFGKTAYTALSVPDIALKYDVLILPCYGIRQADGLSFRLWFDEPVRHSTPEEMGQRLNDSLEAMVRQHPGLWLWLHRRWKDEQGRSEA